MQVILPPRGIVNRVAVHFRHNFNVGFSGAPVGKERVERWLINKTNEVLGVERSATEKDLKNAFRRLARPITDQ